MSEENRYKFTNFDEIFGKLQETNRVKRKVSEFILILGVLIFLQIFGIITYIASDDILTLPFCVILPFTLICGILWHGFSTRNDVLKIYENGFTYKSQRKLQACLWSEIESVEHIDSRHRDFEEIEQEILPLDCVIKKNGEKIVLSDGLKGTTEIEKRFGDFRRLPKKR